MVYIFLANGFEEIEAIAPLDIFRRAKIDALTVGVTGKTVTGAHGIKVESDISLSDVRCDDIEAVVLPGGLPGTENLDKNSVVRETVDYANKNKKIVCAICAAPSILGKMGILDGKTATCYPGFEEFFGEGKYVEKSVVKCENVITSNGMGSAYEFGFEITAALKGADVAESIKNQIQYKVK